MSNRQPDDNVRVAALLRELAPGVLATVLRRHRQFDVCEDATQEALIAAAAAWRGDDLPKNPRGWLVAVANRRVIDQVRAEQARSRREQRAASFGAAPAELLDPIDDDSANSTDDTLGLLLLCCHPALTPASQIALTLRAVGGLTTAEIAGAFFVPETTMAQRVSRAKAKIEDAGARFELPTGDDLEARVAAVMHTLYLMFTEGHTAQSGDAVHRVELTAEAIRLARQLVRLRPADAEAEGLLALMLLTEARTAGRTSSSGDLIPLAEQDRTRWNHDLIDEGAALVATALQRHDLGTYQLQAAIAALHDEATDDDHTDWAQIVALYDLLEQAGPNPIAAISRAIAIAKLRGSEAGLTILDALLDDDRIANHHTLHAARAVLLRDAGNHLEAQRAFLTAAHLTLSEPERRHLLARAARHASH